MRSLSFIILPAAMLLASASAFGGQSVNIEKVKYFNQPNCYKLSNGEVEVIATTDIGPRIIRYSFVGGDNMLAELGPEAVKKTELGEWHAWGGHRLWHAPEELPRTYVPDDSPIKAEKVGSDSVRLVRPVEEATGIEKEILIKLDASGSRVTITHKLTNRNLWEIELAPWALTIVAGGGTTIIPNEPYISHDDKLLPARPIVVWHYTDLSDPRFTIGKKFIRLHTDEKLDQPQKLGVLNKQGWAGYLKHGTLFVKTFPFDEKAIYGDYGCNCETYTGGTFMEIESVGPMTKLGPGKSVTHVEEWFLFKGVDAGKTEDSLEAALKPLLSKVGPK